MIDQVHGNMYFFLKKLSFILVNVIVLFVDKPFFNMRIFDLLSTKKNI